ncbi:hypothetical protein PVBG_06172 [Plasmodium vivax Brazil I]|uniref:Uncharacterized protein n=1 Tax=Plasmodium vivax (strain Brazil I) TaxID=1033975 RepID=A0A0J9SLK5_PLAV1|nr:hypothetical protein PVBG_06172 [Plasmodium vivax Brazil I]
MGKNMHKFVNSFDTYKSIFNQPLSKLDSKYETYCEQLNWKDSSSETYFHDHCKKSMKYLIYLEEKFRNPYEAALGMVFLYCWLFDNVLSKFSYDGKKLDIYKNMLKQLSEIEYSNLEYIFQEYIQEDIIEVLQILYDLYDKFNKFKNNENCGSTNCYCAEYCVNLYRENIKDCTKKFNVGFCDELYNFRNHFNQYISSKVPCPGKDLYLPSNKSISKSVIILVPFVILLALFTLFFILLKVKIMI